MSYQTMRNIHIETGVHSPKEISTAFCERFNAFDLGLYAYQSKSEEPCGTLDFDGIHACAWYSECEDLSRFSTLFPSAVITVSCAGENPEDVWQNRYQAGLVTRRERISRWSKWSKVDTDFS